MQQRRQLQQLHWDQSPELVHLGLQYTTNGNMIAALLLFIIRIFKPSITGTNSPKGGEKLSTGKL